MQRSAGNRAVAQAVAAAPIAPVPISRLMDVASFKDDTKIIGQRSQALQAIDRALTAYHATARTDWAGRSTALAGVIAACQANTTGKPGGRRQGAVAALRSDAQAEQTVYSLMAAGVGQDGVQKFRSIAQAQEAVLALESTHPTVFVDMRNLNLQNDLQAFMTRQVDGAYLLDEPAFQQAVQDHFDILDNMRNDPETPGGTREILNEILGHVDQVRFIRAGRIGSRLTNPAEGAPEKYTTTMVAGHAGGAAERTGYLAHEVTHAVAGEAYDNMPTLLLFSPDTTDAELVDLVGERERDLNDLRNQFEAGRGAFTGTQQGMIDEKLDYGSSPGRVSMYANSFLAAGRIDRAAAQRLIAWEDLVGRNRSGLLVEYDTVLNQMLVWMRMWGIDAAHPFYVALQQAAARALARREAARRSRAAASQNAPGSSASGSSAPGSSAPGPSAPEPDTNRPETA